MGLIASVLQVRPGEERPVALLFALSFCCGAATVTFESAAGAQFLADFSADQLSWVYILSAGVTSLIGWIYIRLERGLELATLLRGTMSALLIGCLKRTMSCAEAMPSPWCRLSPWLILS